MWRTQIADNDMGTVFKKDVDLESALAPSPHRQQFKMMKEAILVKLKLKN